MKLKLTLGAIGLLIAGTLLGTTVLKMDLTQLVAGADTIVQGRVTNVYTQWDPQLKVAFTYSEIHVDDPLKGERRSSVLIRQIGGRIGAMSMSVAGLPTFSVGDEVLVFLAKQSEGTFGVLGLNQGRFDVDSNQEYVMATASGVDLYNPKSGHIEPAHIGSKIPIDAFKTKVREMVK